MRILLAALLLAYGAGAQAEACGGEQRLDAGRAEVGAGGLGTACAAPAGALRAAALRVDITPRDLRGLNPMGGSFTAVHDPIYLRALLLDDGRQAVALVSLDLIEVGDTTAVRERIAREVGVAADHVLISPSHDHNAPRLGRVTPGALAHDGGPESDAYTAWVYDRMVAVLREARAALRPARLGSGRGQVDVNMNRDAYSERGWGLGLAPQGPSDKTLRVLKVETEDGAPLALVLNYGVHSTVTLGSAELSGDLAGAAERYVEETLGQGVVALWTPAALGDQAPRVSRPNAVSRPAVVAAPQPAPAAQQPADVASRAAAAAASQPDAVASPAAAGVSVSQRSADRRGASVPGEGAAPAAKDAQRANAAAWRAMDAQGLLVGAEALRVADGITILRSDVHLAAAQRVISCPVKTGRNLMSTMKQQTVDHVPVRLSLLLIDRVALAGVSGEVLNAIGSRLYATSPLSDTFLVSIANDRIGYLPPDAAYDQPLFEVNGSPVARGCAENAIVDGLSQMIREHM
ncbi:hypothetical protein GJ699_15805 [Duganella sp. FT80W]|uniref:Neutral/alkaline non-lysosomal ceramidase N-terminal domain-containing protein n=1 Tax=Duganella guangzhouensis TaxID=2666084 RepID=A0A6I2L2K5_9BURK|nr:hypothetical protein [Duganella guangzhouensis]MRW91457.1 hypothetical protein [Duganella guangzhouensis]